MKRFLGIVLLLAAFSSPALAQINVWQDQGVILALNSGTGYYPAQPNVIPVASGCTIVASPCYAMWYTCASANICYAESVDGKTSWTVYVSNPIISTLGYPKVYIFGGTYYLYASTFGGPSCEVFTSTDRVTWTLQNANALTFTQSWEDATKFIGQPGIYYDGVSTYYMYYTAYDTSASGYAEGEATSTDLIHWTKNASNPIITAGNPGNFSLAKVGTLYYAWTHSAPSAGVPQTGPLPSDMIRFHASTINGPWVALPVKPFYRTRTEEGVGSSMGQVADPFLMQVGTCTNTSNCSIYLYYTISLDGSGDTTSQISLAIAPNQTFASLVQTYEGVYDVPFPLNTGLVTNLNQLASDTFTVGDSNFTQVTSNSGWNNPTYALGSASQPTASTKGAAYWSAISWTTHADQCAAVTLGTGTSTTNFFGALTRASTSGAATYYDAAWGGAAAGSAGTLYFQKYVAGTFTSLTNQPSVTFSTGDVLTFCAIGTTLSAYQNGNLLLVYSDSSISSGAPGIYFSTGTSGTATMTAFKGYSVQNAPSIGAAGQVGGFLISSRRDHAVSTAAR